MKAQLQRPRNQRGQVIIEYVLLMVIAVSLAVILTRDLVSRNPDNPGILTQKWYSILDTIGKDWADTPP